MCSKNLLNLFLVFLSYSNIILTFSEIIPSKTDSSLVLDSAISLNETNNINSKRNSVHSLQRSLEIFNLETVAKNWDYVRTNLTSECDQDTATFLQGLENQDLWALKMDDANGRYTTGWFWGNQYWTGSQTLCYSISLSREDSKNVLVKDKMPTNHSLSPEEDEVPPFDVSFYMLKVNVNTTSFVSKERTIFIGLCLPKHCTKGDVRSIMEKTAELTSKATIEIERINSHHQRYDMLQDTTFRILCGATIGIVMMLIAGTAYDLYLQKLKKDKKKIFPRNFDIADPIRVTLDMDKKSKGKQPSIFVVQNNNNVEIVEQSPETSSMESEDENPDCTSIMEQILLSFSIRINMKAICDQSVGADCIPTIHGLRSISMAWVILGHTCIVAFKYSDNMDFRKLVEKEFLFQTITNGAFSVDTFFFISGLLVSFLYFRTNAKGKLEPLTRAVKSKFAAGCLHFFGLLFYRFARLTAPYLFVLGIVEVSMKWFHYNSIFEPPTMDHENCPNFWWRNILYINTLFPVEEMCMLWSWYLSDDTQFYIFGAIILILANSHFKTAGGILGVFMLSSWLTTGYIAFQNNAMPSTDDPLALFDKIYDKPWTRLGPYLVGMLVGWVLFKTNCQIKMSKLVVVVGWLTSFAVLLSLVYGLYETNLTPLTGAAYSSLSHTAWALGLAWIVVACTTGYGGYINKILSSTILYPFSRVTYCAYLIHPVVLRVMTMAMDSPLHLGKETMAIVFLGQMVASYILSFAISVAVEAPVVTMLKILSRFKVKKNK